MQPVSITLLILQNWKSTTVASTILLSVSVDLAVLGTSRKWNHTVFIYLFLELKKII